MIGPEYEALIKPLDGFLVLDFSQFLSGPSAALRLADLGARVIKIEKPDGGDICRNLYISNLNIDGESTLFHSINRNKESFSANLKQKTDLERVKQLIAKADVMINNFRPGVMEKLGLSYDEVKKINSQIIYGEITGYGKEGPWKYKPGQDLLVQSLSGLAWLNGDSDRPPQPFGLAIADMIAGAHLVQGILACIVQTGITGEGSKVEVSLLESTLDFQFEVLTTYLNDGEVQPSRSELNNAHAYLGAPYGLYETKDGYIALAMGSVPQLGNLINCLPLTKYVDSIEWFEYRDEIKTYLADHLSTQTTQYWLNLLEPADFWCADVLTWNELMNHDGFNGLKMVQEVGNEKVRIKTTRCPIRIDGKILTSEKGAPKIGENNASIIKEFIHH